jgi:hypothetical protein
MHKIAAIAASTAALVVVTLNDGQAMATGTWPAGLPLPTNPGIVASQTSTTAVVRSTDTVAVVQRKLDNLYLTQKGCTLRMGMNRPRDYLCHNPRTGNTHEVVFTFAALDPTASDPARSQTNATYFQR